MKTVREKVEEWLEQAPKEIGLKVPLDVSKDFEQLYEAGRKTPGFVSAGYSGTIYFRCNKWEEDE